MIMFREEGGFVSNYVLFFLKEAGISLEPEKTKELQNLIAQEKYSEVRGILSKLIIPLEKRREIICKEFSKEYPEKCAQKLCCSNAGDLQTRAFWDSREEEIISQNYRISKILSMLGSEGRLQIVHDFHIFALREGSLR